MNKDEHIKSIKRMYNNVAIEEGLSKKELTDHEAEEIFSIMDKAVRKVLKNNL